jgi:PAS domain S-box-containing protein
MTSEKLRNDIRKYLPPVLIFTICGTAVMVFLDAFDWFYHHSRRYEAFDYDEIIVFMIFFFLVGMLWVFFRLYQNTTMMTESTRKARGDLRRENPKAGNILPQTASPSLFKSLHKLKLSLSESHKSPLLLLISLALAIAAAETLDMVVLQFLPRMPIYLEAFIDVVFLLIMISPALYFIFFRPLVQQFIIREDAEKELRESEQKFRILAERSPNMIFIFKNDDVVYVNDRCEEVMGYTREELYRPEFGFMTLMGPESKNLLDECFLKHEQGGDIPQLEYTLVSRDGRKIEAIMSCKVIQYEGDDAILGIVTDITRHKQAEEALNRLNLELENRVGQRTAQLQTELEERKRAEERLVEHQRQLRALSSELSLVEEREKRRLATDLHDNVGHSLAMVNNQLGLLQASVSSAENKELLDDIKKLVKESIRYTRSLTSELSSPLFHNLPFESALEWLTEDILEKNGVIVHLKINDTPRFMNESARIVFLKAIREILVNIVKHAEAVNVEISLHKEKNDIVVVIKDDGVGFDFSENSRIATAGHQGLGIFSVRERLAHLNGRFSIDTKPDQGTSVTLTVPEQNYAEEKEI